MMIRSQIHMIRPRELPLLRHSLSTSVLVHAPTGLPRRETPVICILDTVGRLTKSLAAAGQAEIDAEWTGAAPLYRASIEGMEMGIVPGTIGGPYAALAAEQLTESGTRCVLCLTEATAVDPDGGEPCLIVPVRAIRDEGTSLHYLEPGELVSAPAGISLALQEEIANAGMPVRLGTIWTTDAPQRLTEYSLRHYTGRNVLGLDMQTASLYAFAAAQGVLAGVVAARGMEPDTSILAAMGRAGARVLEPAPASDES